MGSCVKYDPRYSLQTSHEFFCEGTQRRFVRHDNNIFLIEMRVPAFLFRTMQSKEHIQQKERVVFILRCITQDVGEKSLQRLMTGHFGLALSLLPFVPPFFQRLNNLPLPQFVNSSLPPHSAPSSLPR